MEPSPRQWQELLDAIARLAPDPFWSTATPIVTTLFAVFGGWALSQWNESIKAKREAQLKRREEIRLARSDLVNYLTRWSHAADKPRIDDPEFVYSGRVLEEVALRVSLTGDQTDAVVTDAIETFIDLWRQRARAAQLPEDDHGSATFEFTSEDVAEMNQHRLRFISLLLRWQDSTISVKELLSELEGLGVNLAVATARRREEYFASWGDNVLGES
jgi:hypothetical protein